jgi:hypothetical protein
VRSENATSVPATPITCSWWKQGTNNVTISPKWRIKTIYELLPI